MKKYKATWIEVIHILKEGTVVASDSDDAIERYHEGLIENNTTLEENVVDNLLESVEETK